MYFPADEIVSKRFACFLCMNPAVPADLFGSAGFSEKFPLSSRGQAAVSQAAVLPAHPVHAFGEAAVVQKDLCLAFDLAFEEENCRVDQKQGRIGDQYGFTEIGRWGDVIFNSSLVEVAASTDPSAIF